MVRVRVRAILDCDVMFICVHRYGGIVSEDASQEQQRIGPIKKYSVPSAV